MQHTSTRVRDQHHGIDRALLEIDSLLDEGPFAVQRLRGRVGALAMLLQSHFEFEESSAMFTELPLEFPRFGRRIEALKREHVDMLVEVRSIAEAIGEEHPDIVALRLRALMARLGLHEAAENALLQKAFTEDIAPVD